jgi:hypothetical protein
MEHFFPSPKITTEDIKNKFTNIMNKIRGKSVESSPNTSQIGLNPSLSPLNPLSNLTSDISKEKLTLKDLAK